MRFSPKVPGVSTVRVLFLGPARTLAGVESAEVPTPPTLAALRSELATRFPPLARALPAMRLAVNLAYAEDGAGLQDGDEVAVIPPVSGGMTREDTWIALYRAPLPWTDVHAFLGGDPRHGGCVTFEGVTRAESHPEHGPLLRLEYEAYEDMALREMTRLAEEARAVRSAGRVVLLHRLGAVPIGEASVIIAVAAGHRAHAFDACRFLIDALKRDVPIWKKNVFTREITEWVAPPGARNVHERGNPARG